MEKIKGKVKKINNDTVTVVASSGSVDRDGDVLDPNGWVLDNFNNNPVLLWSHRADQLPIGKVLDVHVEGNELVAEVKFAEHDFAKDVEKLVKEGFLNTTSVGFMPMETDEKDNTSSRQELLELSFVNVPANPTATVRREYKEFQAKVKRFEQQKTPACRQKDESKENCVARKIKEILSEGKTREDQAIAMANSMCEKECDEKTAEVVEKAGRIISEKNRNILRVGRDALQSSIKAIDELLEVSEPQSDIQPEKPKQITEVPNKKGIVNKQKTVSNKDNKSLRIAKMMDKLAEALIHEQRGGEKNDR